MMCTFSRTGSSSFCNYHLQNLQFKKKQIVVTIFSFENVLSELGMAQRKFAQCLGEFQFEYIGDAKTDDERCIGKSGLFFFFLTKPLVWLNPLRDALQMYVYCFCFSRLLRTVIGVSV